VSEFLSKVSAEDIYYKNRSVHVKRMLQIMYNVYFKANILVWYSNVFFKSGWPILMCFGGQEKVSDV